MGIKKCRDCGGQVSSSAKNCPHCGKPQGMGSFQQLLVAAAIGIAIASWWTSGPSTEPSSPKPDPEPMTAEERAAEVRKTKIGAARYACRRAITQSLHDPDSADWTPGYEWPASIAGTMVTLQPSLRANNAFGGKVFQSFSCVVDSSRSNGQHIVRLE